MKRSVVEKHFKLLPNQITGLRIVLVLLMWVFAFSNLPVLIGYALILAGLTDFLDGFLARRLNLVTEFGSKFDSLADNQLFISVFVWVMIFYPEIFTQNFDIILFAVFLNGLSLMIGWWKFNRFANLHLYSSKIAALTGYVFLIQLFLIGYHPIPLITSILVYMISSTEALLIQLMLPSVDEHMRSIIFKFRDLQCPSIHSRR